MNEWASLDVNGKTYKPAVLSLELRAAMPWNTGISIALTSATEATIQINYEPPLPDGVDPAALCQAVWDAHDPSVLSPAEQEEEKLSLQRDRAETALAPLVGQNFDALTSADKLLLFKVLLFVFGIIEANGTIRPITEWRILQWIRKMPESWR